MSNENKTGIDQKEILERQRMFTLQALTMRLIGEYGADQDKFKKAAAKGKVPKVTREAFNRTYGKIGPLMKALNETRKEEFRIWWDEEMKKANVSGGVIGGW